VPVNDIRLNAAATGDKPRDMNSTDKEKKDFELFKYLINVRTDLATEMGISAQKICNNTQLTSLSRMRPSTRDSLARIEGFPYEKINTIGVQLVEKIAHFCKKFGLETDVVETKSSDSSESKASTTVI
jgi:superfamily II DNA helicase RecQ